MSRQWVKLAAAQKCKWCNDELPVGSRAKYLGPRRGWICETCAPLRAAHLEAKVANAAWVRAREREEYHLAREREEYEKRRKQNAEHREAVKLARLRGDVL